MKNKWCLRFYFDVSEKSTCCKNEDWKKGAMHFEQVQGSIFTEKNVLGSGLRFGRYS